MDDTGATAAASVEETAVDPSPTTRTPGSGARAASEETEEGATAEDAAAVEASASRVPRHVPLRVLVRILLHVPRHSDLRAHRRIPQRVRKRVNECAPPLRPPPLRGRSTRGLTRGSSAVALRARQCRARSLLARTRRLGGTYEGGPFARVPAADAPCTSLVALGVSPARRVRGGEHQESPARCIKRRGRDARKRVELVNDPVAPAVVVVAADAANYPVIFFEIPVATVAAGA